MGTRICAGALLALIAIKLAWSALYGKTEGALVLGLVGVVLPLLPALIARVFSLSGFWVYAGFAPLWYFCHGVMELVAGRYLFFAAIEVLLALLFFSGYWLRTRAIKRAKAV